MRMPSSGSMDQERTREWLAREDAKLRLRLTLLVWVMAGASALVLARMLSALL